MMVTLQLVNGRVAMEIESLLPSMQNMRLEGVKIGAKKLMFSLVSMQKEVVCPACAHNSHRRHSCYQRRVIDLAWADRMACLALQVRRFFCDNPACSKRTFSERLPEIVAPYARRTQRLAEKQRQVGLAFGGEAGARMLTELMMPLSGDTLLRLIRDKETETVETPRVLGVDDWAWCKGRRYGTILVDLEKHQVVDLLSDRTSEGLAQWLKAHPGVEIICRDRSAVYIEGATTGAPEAVQVADRWHLLKNLSDHLVRLLERHAKCLYAAPEPPPAVTEPTGKENPEEETAEEKVAVKPLPKAEQARQATRKRRLARYEAVMKLHQAGVSQREISRRLGIGRNAVGRYVNAGAFPEMAQRKKKPGLLTPYLPYLTQQWQAGQRKGKLLFQAIVAQGYQGSFSLLGQWLARMAKADPAPKTVNEPTTPEPPQPPPPRPWAARRAVWLLMKPPTDLSDQDQAALGRMLEVAPQLLPAYRFAQAFMRIVRHRFSKALQAWIEAVITHKIPKLVGFARGLLKDQAAVLAALELPWSSGQVEGQVNRLKLIKRTMYGRANFDLLRLRVLAR